MSGMVWGIALTLLGAYMLVLSIGSFAVGAVVYGVVYLLVALLNFAVAVWRLIDG